MKERRRIQVDGTRPDWPRTVAKAMADAQNDIKALEALTDWAALDDYADDTAAATGGVAVGSLYRTGSAVKVRVS